LAEAHENEQVCISKKATSNETTIRLFSITAEPNEGKWKATLQGTEDVSGKKCNVLIRLFFFNWLSACLFVCLFVYLGF